MDKRAVQKYIAQNTAYVVIYDTIAYDVTNFVQYIISAAAYLDLANILGTPPDKADTVAVFDWLNTEVVAHILIRRSQTPFYIDGFVGALDALLDEEDRFDPGKILITRISKFISCKTILKYWLPSETSE